MKFPEKEDTGALGSGISRDSEELQIEADRGRFPGHASTYVHRKVELPKLPVLIEDAGPLSHT